MSEQPATTWHGEGFKDFVTSKGWKSADEALTSYQALEKMPALADAGRTLVLPKDDADAEGIKAFRAKLGVPDKVDGYALPDALKEDKLFPIAREAALKHGIPAKAFDGFIADVLGAAGKMRTDSDAAETKASEDAAAAVKAKYGNEFDAKLALGKRLVAGLGLKAEDLAKIEGSLGTAHMLDLFIGLGAKLGEAGNPSAQNQGGGAVGSQAEAQIKLDEARAKRIAGQLTEKEFFAIQDKYGPIASPGFRDDQNRQVA